VAFTLGRAALSYWSPERRSGQPIRGTFEIQVGASSRDIRLRAPLVLEVARMPRTSAISGSQILSGTKVHDFARFIGTIEQAAEKTESKPLF